MSLNEQLLAKLVVPKPFRKGATEEQIFAAKAKAQTTAALVAAVKKAELLKGMRG